MAKILIVVKTYPVVSKKHIEISCTAGVREDGSWVRLYPIPFRMLQEDKKYKKYQWIEVDIEKNRSDFRSESFKVVNKDTIKIINNVVNTANKWQERKSLVLSKNTIYDNFEDLINQARDDNKKLSLAIFKPKRIIKFTHEKKEEEWSKDTLKIVDEELLQLELFDDELNNLKKDFKLIPKVPYKFSYIFEDKNNKKHKLMIEDWETGQLYWSCKKHYKNEKTTIEKVKYKYFDDFAKTKDLHFFVGTTKRFHNTAKNPFIIIGTFHPPL